MIQQFLQRAQDGRPVYLHEVRSAFADAPETYSVPLRLSLTGKGQHYEMQLLLPAPSQPAETEFLRRYACARIYNLLSTYGGRRLTIFLDADVPFLNEVFRDLSELFCISLPRGKRTGYGKCINVTDRINAALGEDAFEIQYKDIHEYAPLPSFSVPALQDATAAFRRAVANASGRILCGVDIGGTDIKACLAVDGVPALFKEYDWNPANFYRAQRIIAPILLIVRLLRDNYALSLWEQKEDGADGQITALRREADAALQKDAGDNAMLLCCEKIEALLGEDQVNLLDGVGLSYPDVVIKDKIVGGETSKTAGLRANPDIDYEQEFAKLTALCGMLRTLCRDGGQVHAVNDGPMAAYTAAVELTEALPERVQEGVFAHTLGTELGTGLIDEGGKIPDIPLEVYNYIIDLGSSPESAFPAEDVRSTRNLNTNLPGTLQKYAGQSGVFRLAVKYFPEECPALYESLFQKGFLVRNGEEIRVKTAPEDMRKPFLEFLMSLAAEPSCPEAVRRIFREIGEYLAATFLETQALLHPKTAERMLFGRLVKHPACFLLMQEGAKQITEQLTLTVADDTLACTPLMRGLASSRNYTVAQFAQAVGAVYFVAARF